MRRALPAVTLGLVLIAGCGGDDGPSKEDFAKRADAICADLTRALRPLNAEAARVQRGSDVIRVFNDLARVTQRTVDATEPFLAKLDGLETPSEDRDKLKSWLADGRRQLALLTDLSLALAARDQAKIVRVSEQVDELNSRAARFARSYGMARCAQRR